MAPPVNKRQAVPLEIGPCGAISATSRLPRFQYEGGGRGMGARRFRGRRAGCERRWRRTIVGASNVLAMCSSLLLEGIGADPGLPRPIGTPADEAVSAAWPAWPGREGRNAVESGCWGMKQQLQQRSAVKRTHRAIAAPPAETGCKADEGDTTPSGRGWAVVASGGVD